MFNTNAVARVILIGALAGLTVLLMALGAARGAPAPLARRERHASVDNPAELCGDWFMGWQTEGRRRNDTHIVAGWRTTLRPGGEYYCGRGDRPDWVGTWRAERGWVVIRERRSPTGTDWCNFRIPMPDRYEAEIPEGPYRGVVSWLCRPTNVTD